MITVTKSFDFCYAHHLPEHAGKCACMHGHNACVEVEFASGEATENSGPDMVMDFSDIKQVMEPILDKLDHQYLNHIPGFRTETGSHGEKVPTVENITRYIRDRIRQALPPLGAQLVRVRVSETPTAWAEWKML